jgi:hypothetical protein
MAFSKSKLLTAVIVFSILALVLIVTLSLPQPSRIRMNHIRAMNNLRDLNLAEHKFATLHPDKGFACRLRDLGALGLVDAVLASGKRNAYHFEIRCPEKISSQRVTSYTITAVPDVPGTTGNFAVCTDQDSEIWYSANGSVSDCFASREPVDGEYR